MSHHILLRLWGPSLRFPYLSGVDSVNKQGAWLLVGPSASFRVWREILVGKEERQANCMHEGDSTVPFLSWGMVWVLNCKAKKVM